MKAKTIRSLPKARLLCCCLLLFSLFFVHQSCTKLDTSAPSGNALTDAEVTQKFFNVPANAPLAVRRAAEAMKARNGAAEYARAFAGSNGYPVWDKAFIASQQQASTAPSFNSSSAGADTIVIIPILAEGSTVVLSFVRARLNGEAKLDYFRCADYSAYSFNNVPSDSINADKAAVQMMLLNNKVFGYTEFKINDKRLFHPSADYSDTANSDKKVALGSGGTNLHELCLDIIVTTTSNHCPPEGATGHCYGACDHCTRWCSSVSIITTQNCMGWEPDGGSGAPAGPGGDPGGPTGGGGGTPPGDFPCAGSQGKGIGIANPCGNNPTIPPIEPIPETPAPECDPYMMQLGADALFAAKFSYLAGRTGETNEDGFAVRRSEGLYLAPTSTGGTFCSFNFVSAAFKVDGVLHSHPTFDTPTGSSKANSIFSPQDIVNLCQRFLWGQCADSNNAFSGVASATDNPFIVKVNNAAEFRKFAIKIVGENGNDAVLTNEFKSTYNKLFATPESRDNEISFLKMINELTDTETGIPPIALYKAYENCTQYKRQSLQHGFIQEKDCF